tara:strand:+ start:1 stop:681 length:681 start_codon:yes stop_codon:yes gene_type:complete
MYKKKKFLAVITARERSKRLKNKNILKIKKKTLIERSYLEAKKSKFIDNIILSTESKKIIKIAKKFNLHTPYIRPKKLSKDNVGADKVILHAAEKFKKNYDFIILLQPTSPLRQHIDIDLCIKKILKKKLTSITSIYKSKKKNKFMIDILKTGNIRRLNKQSDKKKNNYYLNGAIYITKISDYLKKKELLTKKTGFFIMPENRSIDIDLKQDYLKAKKIIEKNEKK